MNITSKNPILSSTHPGTMILFGFGLMVLFMSYLVYQCTQHPSVMVSNKYYENELSYQKVIDAKNNTLPYTDSIQIRSDKNSIILYIPQDINRTFIQATLFAYHLSDERKDNTITFRARQQGQYIFPTSGWGKGNYKLKLTIKGVTNDYYQEFNFSK